MSELMLETIWDIINSGNAGDRRKEERRKEETRKKETREEKRREEKTQVE